MGEVMDAVIDWVDDQELFGMLLIVFTCMLTLALLTGVLGLVLHLLFGWSVPFGGNDHGVPGGPSNPAGY